MSASSLGKPQLSRRSSVASIKGDNHASNVQEEQIVEEENDTKAAYGSKASVVINPAH